MKNEKLNAVHVCEQSEEGRAPIAKYAQGKPKEGRAKARPYSGPSMPDKNKRIDGVEVWKQYEDLAVPRLKLSLMKRALYTHLVRHSRLEGKRELRFALKAVARAAYLTDWTVRKALRSLVAKGALRLM